MKVLIVNSSMYVYGGAEKLIVRLANYLSKHDIKNALLTTSIKPGIISKIPDTEIIVSQPKQKFHSEMFALHRSIKQIEHRFDIINLHNYPAEMSVWGCKKPVVWQCNEPILGLNKHNPLSAKLSNIVNLLIDRFIVSRYVNEVTVADSFNANRFAKLYGRMPTIIPYGIDVEDFNSDRTVNPNTFNMIQVGMIQPFKNQLESLRILNELKNYISNIKLTFVGWSLPTYKLKLNEYIKSNNLEGYVSFIDHVNNPNELKQIYLAHDLLLHPIHSQGGWLTPFEALCTELPIIVSKEFTASDIIKQNDIGIVSASDNYVNDILRMYNNRKEMHIQAQRGKHWVNENLSWDKYCEQMLNVFNKVINNGKI